MAKSSSDLNSIFTDVADSIRSKKGTSASYYPVDFADEISTIESGDLPTLFEPSFSYASEVSTPLMVKTNVKNGKFVEKIISKTDLGQYEEIISILGDARVISWIYSIMPPEGGSFTLSVKLGCTNFNDSPEISETVVAPSATQTTGYCSVAGLGNEDPTTLTFTYDPDFPRLFEEVRDSYGNEFIKIPTMYRKILTTNDGQITSFAIATSELDSDYKPYPCFIDRTNGNAILPYILIGKWCMSSTTTANSINGTPSDFYLDEARVLAKARGTGYQLYDWQMWELLRNLGLVISHYMKISPDYNYSRLTSVLGVMQIGNTIYVDGILEGSTDDYNQWYCAYDPNDYYSSRYSIPSEATILSHNYTKLSYKSPSSGSGTGISKVGYDQNNPFFNQANEQNGNADSTYYCASSTLGSERSSSIVTVLSGYYSGWYNIRSLTSWSNKYYARLCYRPILNATGYIEE